MICEHLHVFDTIDLLITNYCTVSALTVSTATMRYETYGIDAIIAIILVFQDSFNNIFHLDHDCEVRISFKLSWWSKFIFSKLYCNTKVFACF